MSAPDGTWWCEAYGPPPDGLDEARWPRCFLTENGRVCRDPDQCAGEMADERSNAFRRINERAVDGDPVMRFLADQFPTPDGLLGGPDPGEEGR